MKRLMDAEIVDGVLERTWIHEDGGKKKLTVQRTQDPTAIIKRNRQEFNSASKGYGKSEMQKVASIPTVVLENAARINQIPWGEFIIAQTDRSKKVWNELLNGRDFQAFRTKPGVVKV